MGCYGLLAVSVMWAARYRILHEIVIQALHPYSSQMFVVLIDVFSSRDLQNVSPMQNSKSLKPSSRFFVWLRGPPCIKNVAQCSA